MDNEDTRPGSDQIFDLLVIGGGINGAGIAADAAGRGLSVVLCEMNDLASATSSASTKLVHGGLRYLEHYEFSLVRESLAEREVLMKMAPHIIWPMRFRLPHRKGLRPRWMIRSGLFLYDNLSRRNSLPGSHGLHLDSTSVLREEFTRGFEYSDCWVDDARLVVLNAMLAQQHGAVVLPRTRCQSLHANNGQWRAELLSTQGTAQTVDARAVVNATGPWAAETDDLGRRGDRSARMRLVKGCHLVVRRMFDEEHAWLLQHPDKRVVFVIPYENDYSLIGTTEVTYTGDPSSASISEEETDYLLGIVNGYFRKQLDRSDIVHSFGGVRPLLEEEGESASKLSRDYSLVLRDTPAPLLSVYGGKITTYRRLAEKALSRLAAQFPDMGAPWTHSATLPGGDFDTQEALYARYRSSHPWLDADMLRRWVRSYGTRLESILGDASGSEDLGEHFGAGLYERELDYLMQYEWARTADDVLWRRSKLGLRLAPGQVDQLGGWMNARSRL